MNLHLDIELAKGYKSATQIARRLTEGWVAKQMYCPVCGRNMLETYSANHPAGDFFCPDCVSDFELKSKEVQSESFKAKVPDGEYRTFIQRITSSQNPNFFLLHYSDMAVNNFVIIPNHFFVPEIVEARTPLKSPARRAGWQGCNISVGDIPDSGKIFIIRNGSEVDRGVVRERYQRTKGLSEKTIAGRGWLLDVMRCIDRIQNEHFFLDDVYAFAEELQKKHPNNHHIKDKIRQQMQYLRDKGLVEFCGNNGRYRKI